MVFAPPVARRLLLRRFAAGSAVFGTFLLPAALHAAMGAPKREAGAPRQASGARPPVPLVMLDPGHGG